MYKYVKLTAILTNRLKRSTKRRLNRIWLLALGAKIDKTANVEFLSIDGADRVTIGKAASFGKNSTIIAFDYQLSSGNVVIGDASYIGHNSVIIAGKSVVIRRNVMIGPGCLIVDTDHGFRDLGIPMTRQVGNSENILVDDDAWIAGGVVILKGVQIGSGAIVGAGAVVTKSIPPFEIWAGVPAQKIADRRNMSNKQLI